MYRVVCTPNVSESDCAAAVIENVKFRVQLDPQCYHTFVAVLQGDGIRYECILQKPKDTYQSYEKQGAKKGMSQFSIKKD